MSDTLALVRLLQLASPSLPVGAYSYSQGLEAAVESGDVHDAASARAWIGDVFALSVATMEAPILLRLIEAWRQAALSPGSGHGSVARWNDEYAASRETFELRAETLQMGYSLRKLLVEMNGSRAEALAAIEDICFPTAFAFAAVDAGIDARDALAAYLFAWIENQSLAALKSIPLGQTDCQRLLRDLAAEIPLIVERAVAMRDEELANFAPGMAHASSRHETQYSRIFRS